MTAQTPREKFVLRLQRRTQLWMFLSKQRQSLTAAEAHKKMGSLYRYSDDENDRKETIKALYNDSRFLGRTQHIAVSSQEKDGSTRGWFSVSPSTVFKTSREREMGAVLAALSMSQSMNVKVGNQALSVETLVLVTKLSKRVVVSILKDLVQTGQIVEVEDPSTQDLLYAWNTTQQEVRSNLERLHQVVEEIRLPEVETPAQEEVPVEDPKVVAPVVEPPTQLVPTRSNTLMELIGARNFNSVSVRQFLQVLPATTLVQIRKDLMGQVEEAVQKRDLIG